MHRVNVPIPFWKMSGAGNDFIIIDHRQPLIPQDLMPEFARRVCRRKFSAGADGLFLIEPSDKVDFKWRFFNADGSEAEMCGNGARCVARFAYMHGIAAARMQFETLAGVIDATVADTQATIRMTSPHSFRFDRQVEAAGQMFMVHSVDTGVPHAGIFVNFVGRTAEGFRIRTYERGVEDETLACGTGVVAGALIAAAKGMVDSPVAMDTAGGIALTVQFTGTKGGEVDQVVLKGPAHLIYKGELTAEALLD